MSELEKEISAIENEMATAFNQGDVEKILTYFTSDMVGFSSTTHERILGSEALRSTFEYYLKEGTQVEFVVSDIIVQDFGNMAVATFHWAVTIHHRDHSHEIPGRGTHVFLKTETGWKIVHEHFSRAQHHE